MSRREETAARHGIRHLADKLVGETAEELEADAAAKAGVIRFLSPMDLNAEPPEPPEPPIEGVPPRDKPFDEYTDKEWKASHLSLDRVMRERAKREQRARREEQERFEAQANRTSDQELGDAVSASLQPGVKESATRALLERLHPDERRGDA
jgi:hypothetical protein